MEEARLSLDNPALLKTTISQDAAVKTEGRSSIKISILWPTTICLGEVPGLDMDSIELVYEAKVRSENLEGTAFLEIWCQVGEGQYFSRGMNSAVTSTIDWKILQTPFVLQSGQRVNRVTMNIVINGKGTIWIDDARLLGQPLK